MNRLIKLLIVLLLALPACAPAAAPQGASSDLPAYSAIEASLFDDTIAGDVMGFPDREISRSSAENTLSARVSEAEFIGEVQVATVTRDGTDDGIRYTLTLTPTSAPLKGQLQRPIEVVVGPTNPSFALVRAEDTRLVNRRMYLLMKRFDDRGEIRVHFRAEPSTPDMLERLRHALTLHELANEN